MSDLTRDSETDQMLRDAARDFLAAQSNFAHRRQGPKDAPATWPAMAALGWFGLAVPEAHGGLGGTARQVLGIMEEAGRALAWEPLLPNLMLSTHGLPWLDDPHVTAGFMTGDIRFAWVERDRRGPPLTLKRGMIHGSSGVSLGAGDATHWLVATDSALLCLQAEGTGVTRSPLRLLDGSPASRLHFDITPAGAVLAEGDEAVARIALLRDRMAAGAVADGFGAAEAGFRLTLDYLKQRHQFGQALSSFQAVQHMMADAFCDLEQLRSLVVWLGDALDGPSPGRARAVSAAKSFLAGRGTQALETCIQLSGGIGVTDDYQLGHYYKRVLQWNALFGDADAHLARLAAIDRRIILETAA